jgi:phosphate transport system permease protein
MTATLADIPPTPPPPAPAGPNTRHSDAPRAISSRTVDDWMSLIGSAVSSLCLVWLLFEQILPLSGKLGFVICWYLAFVALYALVTAMSHPRPVVVDRIASAAVYGCAAVVGIALASTILFTFVKGWPAVHHINFYTHDMAGVGPQDPLTHGGIEHAIVGSLIEIAIAVVIALPAGLATAVYMTEVGGRMARVVRTVVEAMTALPDLVAGLFVYAVLIIKLGESRTGLAAALALAITMLPIIARSSEVVLRVVPSGLREASFALGSSQWRTVWRVVLPTARSGLGTALILGVARGIGETAPVLITSGASTFFNDNPTNNPMNSLPLFIFSGVRSGEPTYITRGYGAATVLLALVLLLFVVVRVLSRQKAGSR